MSNAQQFPNLMNSKNLLIQQRRELAELIGFETRNKYEIKDERNGTLAYAAEQGKGFWRLILRGYLGHWRTFEIHFFDKNRQLVMIAKHPFRWFFQRLEIFNSDGECIGFLQQRFGILTKKFDVLSNCEQVAMEVRSPFWRFWTFPFVRNGREIAFVRKKWSGLFSEALTDRDNFVVEIKDQSLSQKERQIILAAGLFIDLIYFEKKASS